MASKIILSLFTFAIFTAGAAQATANAELCEAQFFSKPETGVILRAAPSERSSGNLPPWSTMSPQEQYQRYGILFTDWVPKLTDQQIAEMHRGINGGKLRVEGQVFVERADQLPFDLETTRAIQVYVSQLEKFVGQRADGIIMRTEKGAQIRGHTHGRVSKATASVTLIGPGSFVRASDGIWEAPTGQTVLFRDGLDSIYHGAPWFSGRRLSLGVSFLNHGRTF